jgi:hypothetical protein
MTLQELINRVKVVALETAMPDARPLLLNDDVLIEVLLPRCMDHIAAKIALTPDGLDALRGEVVVTFVDGVAELPVTVKEEHVETMAILEDPFASYVPTFSEFQILSEPTSYDVSKFTIRSGRIYYNQLMNPPLDFSGNRTLICVLRPALPALIGSIVAMRPQLLEQLITFTATVINGSVPLSVLGLDYAGLEQVNVQSV